MFFTYRKRATALRKRYINTPRPNFFRNKRRRYKKRLIVNANKTFKNRAIRKRPLRNINMAIRTFKPRNFTSDLSNNHS